MKWSVHTNGKTRHVPADTVEGSWGRGWGGGGGGEADVPRGRISCRLLGSFLFPDGINYRVIPLYNTAEKSRNEMCEGLLLHPSPRLDTWKDKYLAWAFSAGHSCHAKARYARPMGDFFRDELQHDISLPLGFPGTGILLLMLTDYMYSDTGRTVANLTLGAQH